MIDLKLAQRQPEILANALRARHSGLDIGDFRKLDEERRALLAEVEALKQKRNQASDDVAARKRAGEDCSALISSLGALSSSIRALDEKVAQVKKAEEDWLLSVPNLPAASTPPGADERDNQEISRWGQPRVFDFGPKAHDEIGSALNGLDFERAAKLAGSRFVVLKGWAARLDRALAAFFLDHNSGAGYCEVSPPYMVNRAAVTGTGQLPKFAEDLFHIDDWDYFLIPTAEVPLTNLYAGEVLDEALLPLCLTAATPCFRSEAGAAGKDTRGLIRMHQFTKVEMVALAHPDDSYAQLERMTGQAEKILQALELPYRKIALCAGDLGFSAAKTYDLEVWLPAQNTYREISSCSNCEDFQARRANIRFRPKGGKAAYAHTLNGSGLPTGRAMAAILENFQQKDGSVVIPRALVPYVGVEVIEPGTCQNRLP